MIDILHGDRKSVRHEAAREWPTGKLLPSRQVGPLPDRTAGSSCGRLGERTSVNETANRSGRHAEVAGAAGPVRILRHGRRRPDGALAG